MLQHSLFLLRSSPSLTECMQVPMAEKAQGDAHSLCNCQRRALSCAVTDVNIHKNCSIIEHAHRGNDVKCRQICLWILSLLRVPLTPRVVECIRQKKVTPCPKRFTSKRPTMFKAGLNHKLWTWPGPVFASKAKEALASKAYMEKLTWHSYTFPLNMT